jgi:hypothetical protein
MKRDNQMSCSKMEGIVMMFNFLSLENNAYIAHGAI